MKYTRRSHYIKAGITAFIVIAASLLFYFLLFHHSSFTKGLSRYLGIFDPLVYGAIIAYILNPLMQLCENLLLRLFTKCKVRLSRPLRVVIRVCSILLTAVFFMLIVYGLVSLLLPQLIDSIRNIVINYPIYERNVMDFVTKTFTSENVYATTEEVLAYADKFYAWITSHLPDLDSIVSNVTTGVIGLVSFLKDFVLGLIIAIYLLTSKEVISAKAKRALFAALPISFANRILHNIRFVDEKFGGFLIGKIIDSAIIGVLCYICVLLMRMPYPILIAVVIGVTNVIPFFGPFIGAIPCAMLVFVTSPIKALYFVLFIIVLQQFDGNILGPYILGNSTGVSSLMIVIAIIICNGLFGIAGAFFGVPLFATLTGFVQAGIRTSIKEKRLPKDLTFYDRLKEVNPQTLEKVEQEDLTGPVSLYDKIKHQDAKMAEGGVRRFLKTESARTKKRSDDLPADPVNVTDEEAAKSRNIPILTRLRS